MSGIPHKVQDKQITLESNRNLFGHMLLIAENRALPIREVLAYPLGPLPCSLAKGDGSMRKTEKAAFARNLEQNMSPAETIPQPSACIIDGMSLVHKFKGDGKTFAQLADSAFKLALHKGTDSTRIDVVFDVYTSRMLRDAIDVLPLAHSGRTLAPGHILQRKKFLKTPQNKISLIHFLV